VQRRCWTATRAFTHAHEEPPLWSKRAATMDAAPRGNEGPRARTNSDASGLPGDMRETADSRMCRGHGLIEQPSSEHALHGPAYPRALPPNGFRFTGVNRLRGSIALDMQVRGGSRPVQPRSWTATRVSTSSRDERAMSESRAPAQGRVPRREEGAAACDAGDASGCAGRLARTRRFEITPRTQADRVAGRASLCDDGVLILCAVSVQRFCRSAAATARERVANFDACGAVDVGCSGRVRRRCSGTFSYR